MKSSSAGETHAALWRAGFCSLQKKYSNSDSYLRIFKCEYDGGVSPVESAGAAAQVHEAVGDDGLGAAGLGAGQRSQDTVSHGYCKEKIRKM